ncbi:uncharacterized protein LOC125520087 isoform X2 [Triticum urartu]|nr:uncharacterized protein LOC125520087 isoform X2 [Triticum urartu]
MASQGWIADKIGDWVKKNPGVGAKDAKGKLEDEFNIKLKYNKAWYGMKVALDQIHGSYENCFPLLFNWKAEIEHKCPGSIVEIELLKNGDKYHFNIMFVAFKPCIDGFLAGCRPYVGVDSTALYGKFKGQLASATAVDGHNWLYYVAFAVFDSETGENWKWFMKQLHRAIGSPPGLVISSDACKGLETAIDLVFPNCENRECMRHLYANFMKKFHGKVYTYNLYPVARPFSHRKFMHHMKKIQDANPAAIEYLDIHHNRLWYRCGFGEASKVDYLTNNISESFNKQIKDFKGLNVLNLFDKIREIITEKFYIRGQVSKQLKGRILPHVIKQLNALSKTIGRNKILWTIEHEAEVTLLDLKFIKRHIVNLKDRTCTCRVWQVSGKPCMHALAFICSINGAEIQTYVDDYYSVDKFKAACAGNIPSMTDKSQWIQVDLGVKVHPPLQQTVAGRPRVQRIRGWLEPGRKIVKCKRCGEPGHMQKTCKVPNPEYMAVDDDIPIEDPSTPTNKRKKCGETTATTDGDATDDEVLINLIRKRARTTPQKPKAPEKVNAPAKKKTPVKIAAVEEKTKKKTPVKKATTQQKTKKKTPVKKVASQEKAKKKTSKGKKVKKNVPFAPVIPPPPPPPPEGQPTNGAKRSLLYWLGG